MILRVALTVLLAFGVFFLNVFCSIPDYYDYYDRGPDYDTPSHKAYFDEADPEYGRTMDRQLGSDPIENMRTDREHFSAFTHLAVLSKPNAEGIKRPFCLGSLVTDEFIITAGSCVSEDDVLTGNFRKISMRAREVGIEESKGVAANYSVFNDMHIGEVFHSLADDGSPDVAILKLEYRPKFERVILLRLPEPRRDYWIKNVYETIEEQTNVEVIEKFAIIETRNVRLTAEGCPQIKKPNKLNELTQACTTFASQHSDCGPYYAGGPVATRDSGQGRQFTLAAIYKGRKDGCKESPGGGAIGLFTYLPPLTQWILEIITTKTKYPDERFIELERRWKRAI